MPATSDSVKVAVRVRPFNQREINARSTCIISMSGNNTMIKDLSTKEEKKFTFDHSYWSHDGYEVDNNGVYIATDSKYIDQHHVFADLGRGVLDNAWKGYNAALFAYGQTGSGKSYSMTGYGPNKGIVPIMCNDLFRAIKENEDKDRQLRVTFSMLEIYNEQVRDLLVKAKPQVGGLRVRQNPAFGFYVEGLKQVPVSSYKEIDGLMEQGTVNRTTASTNMNATSSRSHMVITIKFEQIFMNVSGESTTKSSNINLVDLAGSERADSTGATGDRLKEGSAINQSLSTLGNVISALADQAMGKKKVMVPYRDSILTKLLQSALGGNSRTVMIAALSPADINYEETLSTLRYADRAKKIQNKAVINENPTDRLIRELKEENAKLMKLLNRQNGKKGGDQTTEDVKGMLEENERKMREMKLSWEQRLEEARYEWEKSHLSEPSHDESERYPYLLNVNEDPLLSGVIKRCIYKGVEKRIGTASQNNIVDIDIRGLGIQNKHATICNNGTDITLSPCSAQAQVLVNGIRIKAKTKLNHLDRIKFGSNCLFLVIGFPSSRSKDDQVEAFDYDYFVTELAENQMIGVDFQPLLSPGDSQDNSAAQVFQEFVDLLPKIAEANAISDELDRKVNLELELKSLSSHDSKGKDRRKEVIVRVINTSTRKVWIWSKSKFIHRKFMMDELYAKWLENRKIKIKKSQDPFWDPVEDIFLGSCHVWLKSLAYYIDIDEHFVLHNYHGREEGVAHVEILPCDSKGNLFGESQLIYDTNELLDIHFSFMFKLSQCLSVKWVGEDSSRGVYIKTVFYKNNEIKTATVQGMKHSQFNYKKQFSFPSVSEDFINYLENHSLVLELWGTQAVEETPEKFVNGLSHGVDLSNMDHSELVDILKDKVSQAEHFETEYKNLKHENFHLRKQLEEQKQAAVLSRVHNHKPVSVINNTLDVELAKSLQKFFSSMKVARQQLQYIKICCNEAKESKKDDHIKELLMRQTMATTFIEECLETSVKELKKNVASSIRKP